MAATVRYGSSGEDVRKLQEALNATGNYSLDVDGVFGSNTLNAVKDYQSKNNLSVDGIVGTNTWGSLTGTSTGGNAAADATQAEDTKSNAYLGIDVSVPTYTPTGVSADTQQNLSRYEAGYTPSDVVNQAYTTLQNALNNKPGEFTSTYESQLQDIYNKIMNREDFSYDLNADMLYQQYKDQYTNLGQLAMMDTMGQAAALTGGYGSSYGQSVGQQAYNAYLQQLNEVVPDLYALAREGYEAEGDRMVEQYSLAKDLYDTDYSKYRDTVSDYYTDLDFAYNRYNDERSFDYNEYATMLSYWQTKADQEREQGNWEAQFAYQQAADAVARQMEMAALQQDQANWEAEFNYAKEMDALAAASSSGSGGGSGGYYYSGGDDVVDSIMDKEAVAADLTAMLNAGATNTDLQQQILDAYHSGYITLAEYKELLQNFITPDRAGK